MGIGLFWHVILGRGTRDRLYVRLDDGTKKGTGPDGTWITNEGSVRREAGYVDVREAGKD